MDKVQTHENELAPVVDVNALQKHAVGELDAMANSSGYLPYLQFMSSNSEKCKSGEFPINHFALVKSQQHIDLGEDIDCVPIAWRPKAIDMTGEDNVIVYDRKQDADNNPTGEFARIQDASDNAPKGTMGYMYGPEILLWIPESETFATFFCGGITTRKEAPNIIGFLGNGLTLRGTKIKTTHYTYWSPQGIKCSAPLAPPNMDELQIVADAFNNPEDVVPQKVEEEEGAGSRD